MARTCPRSSGGSYAANRSTFPSYCNSLRISASDITGLRFGSACRRWASSASFTFRIRQKPVHRCTLASLGVGTSTTTMADEQEKCPVLYHKVDPDVIISAHKLAQPPWRTKDPFLFCVYHNDAYPKGNAFMGPVRNELRGRSIGQDFSGKDGWSMYHGETVPGFPKHPHRGFETITITRKGLCDHSDSLGCAARFGFGDCQWMTAGKGISHSEMFPLVNAESENPLELFQIWINLPKEDKMVDPYFKMLWADEIPTLKFCDDNGKITSVTYYAGMFEDAVPPSPPPRSWAARVDADVCVWTIRMEPGATWTLPPCATEDADSRVNRSLYLFRPKNAVHMAVGNSKVTNPAMLEIKPEVPAELQNCGEAECEILFLQGRPIKEPVVQYGPFVMTSQDEIRQAFLDHQETNGFGKWTWGKDDPVHERHKTRFAKYTDGSEEVKEHIFLTQPPEE